MSELRKYYVLVEPWAVYVKDAEFFVSQRGLTEEWGKRWQLVRAKSVEHAEFIGAQRRNAAALCEAAPSPPQDPRDEVIRVARDLLAWDAKYPKDTVYNCGEHTKCEAELTAIVERFRQIKELMGEKG